MLAFGSVHLLTVLLCEEEPVCEPHVKQVSLVPVQSDEVQSLAVTVSAAEEGSRFPLPPGISSCLLYRQCREGHSVTSIYTCILYSDQIQNTFSVERYRDAHNDIVEPIHVLHQVHVSA